MTRQYNRRKIPLQARPVEEHPDGCRCSACMAYCPTPEEIAERAAEIRAGWSEKTEQTRRAVKVTEAWQPPGVTVRGLSRTEGV